MKSSTEGQVMFSGPDSTVSEGAMTAGVCLSVTGGGATELGCPLTITLTADHGKAGILPCVMKSLSHCYISTCKYCTLH